MPVMMCASIFDVDADAVVSPANSFGYLDGGIDAFYTDHFGPDIQLRVLRQIYEPHAGELVVGTADIVETAHDRIPFLIAAPTMRVPMVLRDSPNPYLAARAVFLRVQRGCFSTGPHAGQRISDHVRTVADARPKNSRSHRIQHVCSPGASRYRRCPNGQ